MAARIVEATPDGGAIAAILDNTQHSRWFSWRVS
jgi:hypothetical protein